MKVRLKEYETLVSVMSEEDLSDCSMLESFYQIRKLRALAESQGKGWVDVSEPNESGQVYSEVYEIWLTHWEPVPEWFQGF